MAGITEAIPFRCHGCHLFYEDLQRAQELEAELDTLDHETENEQLMTQDHERKDMERRLARALLGLGYLKEKLEYNQFYAVGCPGFDMSESADMGEAVRIGRCQSPILDIE